MKESSECRAFESKSVRRTNTGTYHILYTILLNTEVYSELLKSYTTDYCYTYIIFFVIPPSTVRF